MAIISNACNVYNSGFKDIGNYSNGYRWNMQLFKR